VSCGTVLETVGHETVLVSTEHATSISGTSHTTELFDECDSVTILESTSSTLLVDRLSESATLLTGSSHVTVLDTGIGPRGPEGPTGVLTLTVEANCLATDAVDDCVYITGDAVLSIYQVSKCDITDALKVPAVGIIVAKASSTECTVMLAGVIPYAGLTPGKLHFVSASGTLTATRPSPSGGNVHVQPMGKALSSTRFALLPGNNITRLIQ